MKKEREAHFADMKKQKEIPVPVIIKDKPKVTTVEKSSETNDILSIDKEVQTKVSQILDIENNFNSKLEIINKENYDRNKTSIPWDGMHDEAVKKIMKIIEEKT